MDEGLVCAGEYRSHIHQAERHSGHAAAAGQPRGGDRRPACLAGLSWAGRGGGVRHAKYRMSARRLLRQGDPRMIIDCAYYQDGRRRQEGPVSTEAAAARCGQGGFVWLGLFEPGPDELAQVRDAFGLHELAVEDAQTVHLRPKLESYSGDVQLVILRTARYDDEAEEVEFGKISVFLAPTFLITVRQGIASELREARQRLEHRLHVSAVALQL